MFEKKEKRFAVKYEQTLAFFGGAAEIIVDTDTGVNYLAIIGNGTAITPLLDEKGQVIIDKE